ncbi:MAG: carbon storage regulator CsrA [Dethiobacteria bacterium]|jgi:carbon storage regulator
MLVLTRKKGQSIVIGENIRISIEEVSGESVRIGIEAPKNVPVYRLEIFEAIKKENIRAAREAGVIAARLKDIWPVQNNQNSNEEG